MKAAQFEYVAPKTVEQAVEALTRYGDGAKILAGGQSLMPLLSLRLARPSVLIDINGLAELDYLRCEEGFLVIGGLTRHSALLSSPLVRQSVPVLAEVAAQIGHRAIRNRGTMGGSLAHADPAAELPTAMTALGAQLVITGPAGSRTVTPEDFFLGYLTTCLGPGELLTQVRVPVMSPATGYAFAELSRRHGDFAIVAVLATIARDAHGRCTDVRIGVGGANPVPLRVKAAEAVLLGELLSDGALAAAAQAVCSAIEPDSDIHATAEHRRELAEVLTRRVLRTAISACGGGA